MAAVAGVCGILVAVGLTWAQGGAPGENPPAQQDTQAEELVGTDSLVFPQIKIDQVRSLPSGRLHIYATFLNAERRAIPLSAAESLQVELRSDGERAVVDFSRGKAIHLDREDHPFGRTKPQAMPRTKSESKMGVLVVMPAHIASPLGPELKDQTWLARLDQGMRSAAKDFVAKLEKGDRANVLLYGDWNYLYVPKQGRQEILERLADAEVWQQCEAARRKADIDGDAATPTPGGTIEALGIDACGLLGNLEGLGKAVENTTNVGKHWPFLFGVAAETYAQSAEAEGKGNPRRAKRELQQFIVREPVLPAFVEALHILARDPAELDQRYLVLISDGRDGYLPQHEFVIADAERECLGRHPDPEPEVPARGRRGADNAEAVAKVRSERRRCVGNIVRGYIRQEQEQFARQASTWLALAAARNIRVHVVGIVSDRHRTREFELERLRVLARESGGTYREARTQGEVYQQVIGLSQELNEQYVIDIMPPFDGGAEVSVELSALGPAMSKPVSSAPMQVELAAARTAGPAGWLATTMNWLHRKVGRPWSTVIAVVVGILVLALVLWLAVKSVKLLVAGLKKLWSATSNQK